MTPGLGCMLLWTDVEPSQRRFIHDVARAPTVRIGMAEKLVIGYFRGQVQHANQERATGCSLGFGNHRRRRAVGTVCVIAPIPDRRFGHRCGVYSSSLVTDASDQQRSRASVSRAWMSAPGPGRTVVDDAADLEIEQFPDPQPCPAEHRQPDAGERIL